MFLYTVQELVHFLVDTLVKVGGNLVALEYELIHIEENRHSYSIAVTIY